ncbi:MAG: LLM class F420-dependent oxidoreductase [Candidatus Dormibacteraeota bacterium]|nr:LLM class F420-dependent oxidoreductase [Candidatus Dormibacteraeota bacterium]MBO0704010.1 LLM class F420-dependent oxidoreductase [Candidatus Dormibacteraeota bacterium]MBO0760360.1 LLM class F420-dependent oxidoreductase [Candidatus Dormibacteraeota bacterium]
MNATLDMGPIGVFTRVQAWQSASDAAEAAAELEDLGFSALWLGGSPSGDLEVPESLIRATRRLVVGTSIVNIWKDEAHVLASSYQRIAAAYAGRLVLGIGIGHAANVGDAYRRPMRKLSQYLDELDAASPPVPREGRAIAALGPRSLAIARERSLGSLPYLVTPEHTRIAREALGPDALLAPEQKVVLDADPAAALQLARQHVGHYLRLPNYTNNLRRLGFEDPDFEDGGSERLLDALVPHGDAEIRARIGQHLDAGANHVALQVLTADRERLPRVPFRALAEVVRDLDRAG